MYMNKEIVYAQAVKGRKGPNDIILRLPNGKIALPRGFTPQEGEWYLIEIEDRGNYAIAQLHNHIVGETGICLRCKRVADKSKLEAFVEKWFDNLIRDEKRIVEIGITKDFLAKRIGDIEIEIRDMIYRLEQQRKRYIVSEFICEPGYPSIDSCFADRCTDKMRCEQLSYMIEYLRYLLNVLEQRYERVKLIAESDAVMTVDTLGIRRVYII
jgi:hypothetical protein